MNHHLTRVGTWRQVKSQHWSWFSQLRSLLPCGQLEEYAKISAVGRKAVQELMASLFKFNGHGWWMPRFALLQKAMVANIRSSQTMVNSGAAACADAFLWKEANDVTWCDSKGCFRWFIEKFRCDGDWPFHWAILTEGWFRHCGVTFRWDELESRDKYIIDTQVCPKLV